MKKLGIVVLALIILAGIAMFWIFNNSEVLVRRMAIQQMADNDALHQSLLGETENITVYTLGTATPLPSDRSQTSTAVFVNGKFFVFDAGYGAVRMMEKLNLPMTSITDVFMTHYHSDHYLDLPYLINRSWQMGRKVSMTVHGPVGTDTVLAGIDMFLIEENKHRVAHHGTEVMNPRYMSATPREIAMADGGSKVVYDQGGIKVTAFDVGHEPVSPDFGYMIEYKGKKVVISGDTNLNANVEKHAQDADLLLHEALLMKPIKQISEIQAELGNERLSHIMHDIQEYHTDPKDIAQLATNAGVKKLVLHHLGPVPDNFIIKRLFLEGLDDIYDGEIVLAEDGDRFVVE